MSLKHSVQGYVDWLQNFMIDGKKKTPGPDTYVLTYLYAYIHSYIYACMHGYTICTEIGISPYLGVNPIA